MEVGKQIKNLRKRLKLTHQKFSDIAGMSRRTVINLENTNNGQISNLKKIAKAFKIEIIIK